MSNNILLIFVTNDGEVNVDIDPKKTINELLKEFLKKTNSVKVLKPEVIQFLKSGRLLNNENNLNKTIESMRLKNNNKIQVIDADGIVGGIIYNNI